MMNDDLMKMDFSYNHSLYEWKKGTKMYFMERNYKRHQRWTLKKVEVKKSSTNMEASHDDECVSHLTRTRHDERSDGSDSSPADRFTAARLTAQSHTPHALVSWEMMRTRINCPNWFLRTGLACFDCGKLWRRTRICAVEIVWFWQKCAFWKQAGKGSWDTSGVNHTLIRFQRNRL